VFNIEQLDTAQQPRYCTARDLSRVCVMMLAKAQLMWVATMHLACVESHFFMNKARGWQPPQAVQDLKLAIQEKGKSGTQTKEWSVTVEGAKGAEMTRTFDCKIEFDVIKCTDKCTITISFPLETQQFQPILKESYRNIKTKEEGNIESYRDIYSTESLDGYYCLLDYLLTEKCDEDDDREKIDYASKR